MKTQEQRIADAAKVLAFGTNNGSINWLAKRVLEAADAEPSEPVWPTDQSVKVFWDEYVRRYDKQGALRAAMIVDPIIAASRAYTDACDYDSIDDIREWGLEIRQAVKDAGLACDPC